MQSQIALNPTLNFVAPKNLKIFGLKLVREILQEKICRKRKKLAYRQNVIARKKPTLRCDII